MQLKISSSNSISFSLCFFLSFSPPLYLEQQKKKERAHVGVLRAVMRSHPSASSCTLFLGAFGGEPSCADSDCSRFASERRQDDKLRLLFQKYLLVCRSLNTRCQIRSLIRCVDSAQILDLCPLQHDPGSQPCDCRFLKETYQKKKSTRVNVG